jgi:mono/diheme cytochrome c family protein
MNKKLIVVSLIAAFVALQSFGRKEQKEQYSFPAAMSEAIRTEYEKMCDKGKVLYEMNCGKCHNVKVAGKWIVPDFTQEQIDGYEIRVGNAKHEQNLTDEAITPEELNLVTTYLMFKRRSGVEVKEAFGGKMGD